MPKPSLDLSEAGRRAAAELVGAHRDEVVLGPSTTVNAQLLARAIAPRLAEGDEVVVTNLDHESNVGPWRALAERGVVLREWRFDPETCLLRPEDLEPLLGPRTRLVCFTHCSNLVGALHDVPAIARLAHEAGAWVGVDGVAYAPHRRVDVQGLGVDFYFASLYKVFGPHLGLAWVRPALLEELESQNHFFLEPADDPPYALMPGNVSHELAAAVPGILDYLDSVHADAFDDAPDRSMRLTRVFDLIAAHESALVAPLLDFLRARPGVRVLGPVTADPVVRAPIVSFVVEGQRSSDVVRRLDPHGVAVRFGHFYAYRAVRDLGLLEHDGVVRVSMAHYNTEAEVDRLLDALDRVLGC